MVSSYNVALRVKPARSLTARSQAKFTIKNIGLLVYTRRNPRDRAKVISLVGVLWLFFIS
jgi:hypothetical protein